MMKMGVDWVDFVGTAEILFFRGKGADFKLQWMRFSTRGIWESFLDLPIVELMSGRYLCQVLRNSGESAECSLKY